MNREQVIERLKQIKARLQSYPMDAIADITFLLERLTGFCEFITNPEDCDSIFVEALKRGNKDLVEQNARLQAQLNKEIHYNRIMKRALEKYAFETTKMEVPKFIGNCLQPQNEADYLSPLVDKPVYDGVEEVEVPYANDTSLALQVLKEIENKE